MRGVNNPEALARAETAEERMTYWRAQYWMLRRMLEHIAETEGDDAAARMRSVAKDALAGKVYAERG